MNENNEKVLQQLHDRFYGTQRAEKERVMSSEKRRYADMQEKLSRIENLQEKSRDVSFYVDYANGETGDVQHTDQDGITYMVKADTIRSVYENYKPEHGGYLLGSRLTGKVDYIDRSKGLVEIRILKGSLDGKVFQSLAARKKGTSNAETLKNMLELSLRDKNMGKIKVTGVITDVQVDVLYVDMFRTGLIAAIPTSMYRKNYIRDLRKFAKVGDTVDGVVVEYRPARKGEEDKYFIINATAYRDYNWKRYADSIHVGDAMIVRCEEKKTRENQTYFWASTDRYPGIDLMCDYSTSMPREHIQVGSYYKVRVKKVKKGDPKHGLMIHCVTYADAEAPTES